MHAPPFLTQLVGLIAIAAVGAWIFERLRLPAVAGYLVMGALVGPGGLGLIGSEDSIRTLAEFGVVFLLFEIGLELPLERLRRLLRVGLITGALQVLLTLGIVALAAIGLEVPWRTALVLGALVAMSSTAVVIGQLADRGEIDAPHGQVALGVLLFQDLCIVPFLLAVPLLAAQGEIGALDIAGASGRALLAAGLLYLVARFVIPRLLAGAARLRSRDVFSLVALLVVVGAALAAESIGLTLAVGAFMAGLAANASPYGAQLFAEVLPLRGILLGMFFTAVGMLLDVRAAAAAPGALALFVAAAIGAKMLIVTGVLRFVMQQGTAISIRAGMALAQTGEFSFVLAAAAAAAGLLDPSLQQVFIGGSVISLIATPFLVRTSPQVAEKLSREVGANEEASSGEALRDHALLIGYGLAGRNIARVLRSLGVRVIGIEANARSVAEAVRRGEDVVYGDATRPGLLRRYGAAEARVVVVAITDPIATRQVVERMRIIGGSAKVFARTRYVLDIDALESSGAHHVVAEELEGAIDLLSHVLRTFGVPSGAVTSFSEELRDEGYALLQSPSALQLDPWLVELLDQVTTDWLDLTMEAAAASLRDLDLRAQTGASVLAVERAGGTTPNPGPDFTLEVGDRVLVFGGPAALSRARDLFEAPPAGGSGG